MRIGYSFWGFIGPGVLDTPDGGRSFRRTVLDSLTTDHDVVLMQNNRDLHEAGHDLTSDYTWDTGLPELDALFLEWRWPLPGRNTTPCGAPGHTCDLHRQDELLTHYTHRQGTRTLIWDLDQTLAVDDPIRQHRAVTVFEPALHPTDGATTLLTPIDDRTLDTADPEHLAQGDRRWPLVYIGNQYHRDHAFNDYFAPAARHHEHRVAGKWTRTEQWPHVNFTGRVEFSEGQQLHRGALATILLLPDNYAAAGHMTQRLPEAVLAGCLPIAPADIRDIDQFVPDALHAVDGAHATQIITDLTNATTRDRAHLLAECLTRLDRFRAAAFAAIINRELIQPDQQFVRQRAS
jgi:hypothetical protein